MKLKRIALSIVAGAALMVPAALTGQSQNSSIVQASTLKKRLRSLKAILNQCYIIKTVKV